MITIDLLASLHDTPFLFFNLRYMKSRTKRKPAESGNKDR